jgi:hypothetical protein
MMHGTQRGRLHADISDGLDFDSDQISGRLIVFYWDGLVIDSHSRNP